MNILSDRQYVSSGFTVMAGCGCTSMSEEKSLSRHAN